MTFEGALPLSQGLVLLSKLETLNLNSNYLSSKGSKLICEALLDSRKLKSLNMSDNGIDDTSAASFGKLIF